MLGKLLAGLLAGFMSAVLAYLLIGLVAIQVPLLQHFSGPLAAVALWVAMLVLALSAPTAGKAWRYLLLLAGLFAFVLPFIAFFAAGMQMDSDLARHFGEILSSMLRSTMLTPYIGTGPAELAGTWVVAADSELLGLVCLAFGTLLLCLGLMVGTAPRYPVNRNTRNSLPGFANFITAKGGTCRFRVLSYRPMSDEEVMTSVWDALEDGRLQEPLPDQTATLVTRIGLDDEAPNR